MSDSAKTPNPANDWELNEEYFQNDTSAKELRLEDFISKEPADSENSSSDSHGFGSSDLSSGFSGDSSQMLLQKTIQDVHNVLSMAQNGQTIPEIAKALHLDEQYVYNIQISAQGFREDDEIAVAHLVMMG